MTEKQIHQGLLLKGYNEKQSSILAIQLHDLSEDLLSCLSNWLTTDYETNFEANGFSLFQLMTNYHLKYPAALLSLNWIIKEPEKAIPTIHKGIR